MQQEYPQSRADACSSQSPSSVSAQTHFVWAVLEV